MGYIRAMSCANCFCLLAKTRFLGHTWYVHGTPHFTNHCAVAQLLFTSHYPSYTRHR